MTPARQRLLLFACGLGLSLAFARAAEPSRPQRLAALPEEDRAWLTDYVAPIILPEEEKVFLQLSDAGQREGFKEDFWQRRETPGLPLPLGPGYRDRYRDLRQVLDGKYIGWSSDAGRLILRRGEPDSILKPKCDGDEVFRDLEVWTYNGLELNGHPATRHILYRSAPGAPRRLWLIHDGNAAAFQPNACRTGFDQLSADCRATREDRCGRCADRCVVYEAWAEILKRQGGPAGALAEQGELFNYPKIPTAGLDRSKAKWVVPAGSSAKAPAAVTTPAPTQTAVPRPTVTPTPTAVPRPTSIPAPTSAPRPTPVLTSPAVAQPSSTPAAQPGTPTRPPAAPQRTQAAAPPTPARPTPALPTPVPTVTQGRVPTSAPTLATTPAPIRAPLRAPTSAPTPKPTAASAPTPATTRVSEGLRRLSPEEIKNRIETLEPEYKEFVDLARPLMSEEELSRFLQLAGHDKDAFMRDFWKRRS